MLKKKFVPDLKSKHVLDKIWKVISFLLNLTMNKKQDTIYETPCI